MTLQVKTPDLYVLLGRKETETNMSKILNWVLHVDNDDYHVTWSGL